MLVFPSMLLDAAKEAGMDTPELDSNDEFDSEQYPHFYVFCNVQLCRPMTDFQEHWHNAKVIASIPVEDIKGITLDQLVEKGLRCVVG